MNDDEYERRRRALDELYQADLLMVRAAHETRLRCLDTLRHSQGAPASRENRAAGLPENDPVASPPSPPRPAPTPAAAPAPARRARNDNPDLKDAIVAALPVLPEVFTKQDVVGAIGFTPSRSSLQRVLMDLDAQKVIRFAEISDGRRPTTYRKV